MSPFTRKTTRALATAALTLGAILLVSSVQAEAAPGDVGLGTAASFGVLAGQGVTNTGPTVVGADLGTCPNPAISGFPPGIVGGTIHANDAVACQAQADLVTAYNDAASRAPTTSFGVPTDLGGSILLTGVYRSASSFAITGALTLDGQNNPDAVFIFQAASTLITATNSSVNFINGAQACNVFWQIGSSATLGVDSTMKGTVMALSAITANTRAAIDGRVLARNAAITLDSNQIRPAPCATTTPTTTPTTAPGATTTTLPDATVTDAPTTTTTSAASGSATGNNNSSGTPGAVSTPSTRPAITVTDLTPTPNATTTRLARTGNGPRPEALLGVALLLAGAVLFAASRRD